MLKTVYSSFIPKQLSCRFTHRYKDYKKIWKKQGILEDWQNMANRPTTLTEQFTNENNDITDISRLPKFLKNRKLDIMKVSAPEKKYETTIDYQRTTFARYGQASNLDPGEVCWPSPDEIKLLEDREHCYEDSFAHLMQTVAAKSQKKQAAIDEMQQRVKTNMKSLPNMLAQFHSKQSKSAEDEQRQLKNRQNLLRQAREHFGFSIKMNDPRMAKFQESLREERKAKKTKLII